MAPKTPKAPKAAKAPAKPAPSKSTAQKPLATGDVTPFAGHAFRADMGEGLPDQANTLNPDRAK